MTEHRPFRFDEHHVVLRLGEGEVLGRDLPGEAHRDGNLVSWDPGFDGLLGRGRDDAPVEQPQGRAPPRR